MYTLGAYLLLSVLLSFTIAIIITRFIYPWPWTSGKERKTTKIAKWLFILRVFAIAIIIIVLFNPGIKHTKVSTEKPEIYFIHDQSASIAYLSDSATLKQTDSLIGIEKQELEKNYKINTRYFSDRIYKKSQQNYSGRVTDISRALKQIQDDTDKQLAAAVLITDGNYNRGENPVFAAKNLSFPVYTVRMGDTTPKADIYIQQYYNNKVGYLNEKIPLEVDLRHYNITSDTTITLMVTQDGKELSSKKIIIKEGVNRSEVMFYFIPEKTGLQQFELGVTGKPDLSRKFYMRINKQKQKVLVLYHAVHPDIGTIRRALDKSNRFDTKILQANEFDGKFSDFTLIILHQIPSGVFSEDRWFASITQKKIPYWIILGSKTDYSTFNQGQNALKITGRNGEFDFASGAYNNQFAWFKTDPAFYEYVALWPPLTVPFGQYEVNRGTSLLHQSLHGVVTERPAWLFVDQPYRFSILSGTGIWKWGMYNYKQTGNHFAIDDLIYKTVKFLSLSQPKKRLVIKHNQLYGASQPVEFEAVFYNKNFEPDNSASGKLLLKDSSEQEYRYVFSPLGNQYSADAGIMPAGMYQYTAIFETGDEVFRDTGSFMVDYTNIEKNSMLANQLVLRQVAGPGRFFDISNVNSLADSVENKSPVKSVRKVDVFISDLIDENILLFFIVLFLVVEWVIRKYNGKA